MHQKARFKKKTFTTWFVPWVLSKFFGVFFFLLNMPDLSDKGYFLIEKGVNGELFSIIKKIRHLIFLRSSFLNMGKFEGSCHGNEVINICLNCHF